MGREGEKRWRGARERRNVMEGGNEKEGNVCQKLEEREK